MTPNFSVHFTATAPSPNMVWSTFNIGLDDVEQLLGYDDDNSCFFKLI